MFHDGDPFAAEDVKSSFHSAKGPRSLTRRSGTSRSSVPPACASTCTGPGRLHDLLRHARVRIGLDRTQEVRREGRRRRLQEAPDQSRPVSLREPQATKHHPTFRRARPSWAISVRWASGCGCGRWSARPTSPRSRPRSFGASASAPPRSTATRPHSWPTTCPPAGRTPYGSHPDIDALYKQQALESDRKKRAVQLHQIQQLLHERVRFAPIWDFVWPSGVGPRVAEPALMLINPYPWSAPLEGVRLK